MWVVLPMPMLVAIRALSGQRLWHLPDPVQVALDKFADTYGVPAENCYLDAREMLDKENL